MNDPVPVGTEQVAEVCGAVLGLPITLLIGRDGRIAAKYTRADKMPALDLEIKTLLQAKV